MRRVHALAPQLDLVSVSELVRPALLAGAAALAAFAFGLLATAVVPTGLALVPVGIGVGTAFVCYLAAVTGRSLRPSALRLLVMELRGTPA
jgi:type IV secretory pathway TrbD component